MLTVFFIPVILLMGIIPVIPFSEAAEQNQICIDKVWIENNKGRIACVTPSTAEKLVDRGWGTILADDTFEEKPEMMELDAGHQIIETRIGTLELQSDYLTTETAQKLKDELFFQRAIQVYHLAYPAMGVSGIFYEQDKVGATAGDILYWSDFMTSSAELLTANVSVLYFISLQDLSDGPIVVYEPAGSILGHIDNLYQQPLTDLGAPGPHKGDGGLNLILPPNYDEEIPDGYTVYQSDTMQIIVLGRSFVNDGDKDAAEAIVKQLNIYKLSESDNPPQAEFFDLAGITIKMAHPTTEGFWEFLHEVYSKETVVRDEDKNLIGLMNSIGIVPEEPFEPDEHSKKLLDEAAVVADLMAKGIGYDNPGKEPYLFYPDKNWENPFMTKNADFEDELGATMIDNRLGYVYQAITVADSMILKLEGKGSKYLVNFRDSDENFLEGSNTYLLSIPADVPAERFWSVVAYDAETRSMIVNDELPRPGFGSVYVEHYTQNDDGSYDVYFGPEAPEGYESNWIKTNEGDGWFAMFRFYSPSAEYYEKNWQLPMIEKIE